MSGASIEKRVSLVRDLRTWNLRGSYEAKMLGANTILSLSDTGTELSVIEAAQLSTQWTSRMKGLRQTNLCN